jgi:hypothetical protein
MDPEYAVHAANCSFRPHIVRMAERLSEFVTLGTTIDDVDSWNTRADWVERFRAASEHYIADLASGTCWRSRNAWGLGQDGSFAVAASQLTRVAKVMKPLHTAFIVPGQNRSTSWWAIGRAMTTTKPAPELRLLVMPVHTSEWPE